jgi:T-complex protein 1 subunit gamma
MQAPVMVLNANTKRETGKTAQLGNIQAAKAVSDIIRTTLGPRSMLKMLLDPMGGIVITNDGNCILREVDVSHPAAKSMIELSRAQDEEVGDGTTSVIILSGEILAVAEPLLERNFHPTVIVNGYSRALQVALDICKSICRTIDIDNMQEMREIVHAAIGTKFSSRWSSMMVDIAIQAVKRVVIKRGGYTEVDVKRFVRVEKIPGGDLSDCQVLDGVMFNKDITHAKMRRRIENPRILLLDCPLEYKKGESQTNVEIMNEEDFNALLRQEEEYIEQICAQIIAFKPDIVITEKGVSDLAQHYFLKANITAFRRLRKTDANRVARAVGATIVNRTDEIQESDIGTGCGLFEVRKIGDEYFAFLEKCADPKACTVLLRGGSKDVLNEIERNLADAMQVVRNVVFDPRMLPGGGATELAIAHAITKSADEVPGVARWPYLAVAQALEVIPRTLAQNCGANVIRLLTELRTKHSSGEKNAHCWGVNGTTGVAVDMNQLQVWEPYVVKTQTLKTAVESACLILRIDDVVSGTRKKKTQE